MDLGHRKDGSEGPKCAVCHADTQAADKRGRCEAVDLPDMHTLGTRNGGERTEPSFVKVDAATRAVLSVDPDHSRATAVVTGTIGHSRWRA